MSKPQKIKVTNKNGDILFGLSWTIDEPLANFIIME